MRRTCRQFKKKAGFYIATHPWLEAHGIVKVGFSADLSRRLLMPNYVTCFTDEWSYRLTLECKAREARLLEYAVLRVLSKRRVAGRELIRANVESVVEAALSTAKVILPSLTVRNKPKYELVGRRSAKRDNIAFSTSQLKRYKRFEKQLKSVESSFVQHKQIDTPSSTAGPTVKVHSDTTAMVKPARLHATAHGDSVADQASSESAGRDVQGADDEEDETIREMAAPLDIAGNLVDAPLQSVALRDYQQVAVERAVAELTKASQTILQMACRSGKTPVAHRVILQTMTEHSSVCRVLFLVPGLALLRQTAAKLVAYGIPTDVKLLLIGSDKDPLLIDGHGTLHMTTVPSTVHSFLSASPRCIILSTYISSKLVVDAMQKLNNWQLTVFDEAHRVCGRVDVAAFNYALLAPQHGNRLFLTATPTYDTPIRMDEKKLFGGIAYRFYLREGIDMGFINNFSVEIILGDVAAMEDLVAKAAVSVKKMLVFCRNIPHAEQLADNFKKVWTLKHSGDTCLVLCAHSRLGTSGVNAALRQFTLSKRAILFNVRLFQEGVEVKDLDAVFFAAPRYSPRDIIQSVCRPLNKHDGKGASKIFIPAAYDPSRPADHPVNMKSFSTLIPFTDALMDEDPSLFEYLIDPKKRNYNIHVTGSRHLRLSDTSLMNMVLPCIRRGVRYSARDTDRLSRPERLPWKSAFAELRRVVLECNRYPKINDAWIVGDARISLYSFYRYARSSYQAHVKGDASPLEVHQIRDLESLPMWTTYGCNGPYPWKECLQTLRQYVAKHKKFPVLEIHRGGFVGLDATPFERLAGALCNINQQDKFVGMSVSLEKQKDLDTLCAAYGLQWRKPRKPNGQLLSQREHSCITASYDQFKRRWAAQEPAFLEYVKTHFPGYPEKHNRMESLAVQRAGTAPPRLKVRSDARMKKLNLSDSEGGGRSVVVCRLCRVEVPPSEWASHVESKRHKAKLGHKSH